MSFFNMTKESYGEYVNKKSPNSHLFLDVLKAFAVGGAICCVGQGIHDFLVMYGINEKLSASLTSIILIFIGSLLTGIGVYDNIARVGGAGTLVPITGFANAVVSPALEFKTEGYVLGTGAKIFAISGPVIVYGVSASIIYGFILWVLQLIN